MGFFGTYFLLRKWTEKEWIEPNPEFVRGMEETGSDSVDDILIKDPGLPHTGEGFLPLLLPVLLISVSSFAQMYAAEGSAIYTICTTIGNKVIALSIGLLYSFYLGYKQRKMVLGVYADTYNEPKAKLGEVMLNKWVARGLVVCLSPLLITAMGGAFGNVLKNSPALEPLSKLIADSPIPAILVPWAIAAIMMTSVGSMTTAGMTAAAIVLPHDARSGPVFSGRRAGHRQWHPDGQPLQQLRLLGHGSVLPPEYQAVREVRHGTLRRGFRDLPDRRGHP